MAKTAGWPTGALEAAQLPLPPTRADVVHRVLSPTPKVTAPLGLPEPDRGWTVAEKVIDPPTVWLAGLAEALRVVPVRVVSKLKAVTAPTPESPPPGSPTAARVPSAESATDVPN